MNQGRRFAFGIMGILLCAVLLISIEVLFDFDDKQAPWYDVVLSRLFLIATAFAGAAWIFGKMQGIWKTAILFMFIETVFVNMNGIERPMESLILGYVLGAGLFFITKAFARRESAQKIYLKNVR